MKYDVFMNIKLKGVFFKSPCYMSTKTPGHQDNHKAYTNKICMFIFRPDLIGNLYNFERDKAKLPESQIVTQTLPLI